MRPKLFRCICHPSLIIFFSSSPITRVDVAVPFFPDFFQNSILLWGMSVGFCSLTVLNYVGLCHTSKVNKDHGHATRLSFMVVGIITGALL